MTFLMVTRTENASIRFIAFLKLRVGTDRRTTRSFERPTETQLQHIGMKRRLKSTIYELTQEIFYDLDQPHNSMKKSYHFTPFTQLDNTEGGRRHFLLQDSHRCKVHINKTHTVGMRNIELGLVDSASACNYKLSEAISPFTSSIHLMINNTPVTA